MFLYSWFFFFFFFFNFLTVHHKKFSLSDFHQKQAFNQYFTSTRNLCFCVLLANLSFFWCLDYSRTNEQIFIKIVVSRTWSREVVTNFQERLGSNEFMIFWIQKIMNFIGPISMYFNDFSFLLDISSKVMNKF